MKKVKVCKHCSNIVLSEIKALAKKKNFKLQFGCLGKCKRKFPELSDTYFALIDNELYIRSSKEELFKLME